MKKGLFFVFLACTLIFSQSAFAQAVKIGDITNITGQVMVESAGKWSTLTKAPHPLYNTDQVVTKTLSKAEISLVDGGTLKLHPDTKISISQRNEQVGVLLKKRTVNSQTIDIKVGTVSFDIHVDSMKRKVQFKSPVMVASIRGTTGSFTVDVSGRTYIVKFSAGGTLITVQPVVNGQPVGDPIEISVSDDGVVIDIGGETRTLTPAEIAIIKAQVEEIKKTPPETWPVVSPSQ